MEEKNYERLDSIIGEKNLQKFDNEFAKCVDIVLRESNIKTDGRGHPEKGQKHYEEAIDRMKRARKYMLAQLLEMWGTWKERGDCYPKGIQMGRESKFFASVIIEEG